MAYVYHYYAYTFKDNLFFSATNFMYSVAKRPTHTKIPVFFYWMYTANYYGYLGGIWRANCTARFCKAAGISIRTEIPAWKRKALFSSRAAISSKLPAYQLYWMYKVSCLAVFNQIQIGMHLAGIWQYILPATLGGKPIFYRSSCYPSFRGHWKFKLKCQMHRWQYQLV